MAINLQPDIEKAVKDLGFTEFTEIQQKTIPLIQEGRDIIGQAFTGSGKTAAFGLPSLEKVTHGQGLQMLAIVPTRELCNQVAKEMGKFSKYKKVNIVEVYGGVSLNPQIEMLPRADIVVATPGRLLDHLERRTINLSQVKILVLDEADKMFEMGFIDDIKMIISKIPDQRQTLLFSATMPTAIHEIARHYMNRPEKVKVQEYVDRSKLLQFYYNVDSKDKFSLLAHLLKAEVGSLTIVFCATKRMVDSVSRNLNKQNVKAQALHGGLSQAKRKQVMDAFHAHKLDVLVASDVAARGLDIKNVSHVVNYDIPRSSLDYVHRIGRTARAGSSGTVISLLAPQDHDNFRRVLDDRSLNIQNSELPHFEKVFFSRGESRGDGSRDRGFSGRGRGGFGGRSSSFGGNSNRFDFTRGPRRHNFGDSSSNPEEKGEGNSFRSERHDFNKGSSEGRHDFTRGGRSEGSSGFSHGPRKESEGRYDFTKGRSEGRHNFERRDGRSSEGRHDFSRGPRRESSGSSPSSGPNRFDNRNKRHETHHKRTFGNR